ncbi:hypothetical protein ACHAWU_001682 [Discostella pseudostelligera]|uniref:Myosin motor domain-containing protein n=1 Tax=Discostella pseudostelligera TaxID=259834 RepID=A0ABD3M988_9STRA
MAEPTKVWVSTSTIDAILHPSSHKSSRLGMHGSLTLNNNDCGGGGGDPDSRTVDWGWTSATILASGGGGGGSGGMLDGKSDITIQVDDAESTYYRTQIVIPGKAIEDGRVLLQNNHGDDYDDDDIHNSGGSYNDDDEAGHGYPDDLITLTHLHEPAVLHCLRKRYDNDKIYTNTGPILIALNPFKSCNTLYSEKIMRQYWERGEAQMLMGGSVGESSAKQSNGEEDGIREEESRSPKRGNSGRDNTNNDGTITLPPHVYALADATYRSMMLKMDVEGGRGGRSSSSSSCDQSILVSGESGAGKTVTTKFIMKYLAALSERRAEAKKLLTNEESKSPKSFLSKKGPKNNLRRQSDASISSAASVGIEQQVLQSNPILESFGNARTIRNDNSSRFGKFIEIRFNSRGTLVGASIETYLLEKVRLISQAEGERNYHIFYEMLGGMNEEELDHYLLGKYSVEDFKITSVSGTYGRRDGILDADTYDSLVSAMEVMGFSMEQQNDVFRIASAVLHLSNLTILSIKGGEECEIDVENEHLEPILQLLGVTKENLNHALCYFKIEARGQSYTRAVQKDKAEKGLEALMKATYSALFDYLVQTINSSITVQEGSNGSKRAGGQRGTSRGHSSFIGVLDIFGFESFKTNSFEQLCINYCNEALQQQFNLFVLKKEQEEYEHEGINWSFIPFPDNQDVLDLVWKKGYGILNILDDQCRAPGTTDKTFANDMYQKLTNKPRFEANFRQVGARQFGVVHYAGLVEYDTDGFVEKNKDELPHETTDLLLSSSNEFVKELAMIISSSSASDQSKSVRGGKKSVTVGSHFASQLASLRAKIDLTSPHYVRCLKPNGLLVPDNFDPMMIVEQLRCAGVVEAVRVSRVGFPQRYTHSKFISRYRTLALREMKKAAKSSSRKVKPVEVLVDAIARKLADNSLSSKNGSGAAGGDDNFLSVGIQVGKTMVFLRRQAFDVIEKMRKDNMATAAIKVQAIARGYILKRTYREYCDANLQLQCWVRVILAARKVQYAREHISALRIQRDYRKHRARASYIGMLHIVRWCQKRHRGSIDRLRCEKLKRQRHSAVVIQCAARVRQSYLILRKLRNEAKSLKNVAHERDEFRKRMEGMRVEMDQLRLAALKESEDNRLITLENEVKQLKSELATAKRRVEEERLRCAEASELAQSLQVELDSARDTIARMEEKFYEANFAQDRDTNNTTLQLKLDEALHLSRNQDMEIKQLKSELGKVSHETSPTTSLENSTFVSEIELSKETAIISREEDLVEIASLRKELEHAKRQADNDSSEYISLSSELEASRLREENEHIRRKLEQILTDGSLTPQPQSAATAAVSHSEKKLKKEIAKLKEVNKLILKTAEEQNAAFARLEKKNADLRSEIENLQDASIAGLAADANSYGDLKARLAKTESRLKAEEIRAENAVARESKLRAEIADMRHVKDSLMSHQTISEEESCDDMTTLQYEIERLRTELRIAKEEARSSGTFAADDMVPKNELQRLAEAGIQKDFEIAKLKLRVSTQDAQLKSVKEEVTEDDLTFGMRERKEIESDITLAENEGLRSLNEELTKQLDLHMKESEDLKSKLQEESSRSMMEMKAFSVALKGVDELRVAAECMSRQLHFIKKNGYIPPTGLTGEVSAEDIKDAMSAVESMARANQSIDHPSISDFSSAHEKRSFNLWSVMNAVMSPVKVQSMHEDETVATGIFAEPITSPTRNRHKSKRKKKGDGGSIISSFF